jgi:hypothetical protein
VRDDLGRGAVVVDEVCALDPDVARRCLWYALAALPPVGSRFPARARTAFLTYAGWLVSAWLPRATAATPPPIDRLALVGYREARGPF